jgi:hypothetical protein
MLSISESMEISLKSLVQEALFNKILMRAEEEYFLLLLWNLILPCLIVMETAETCGLLSDVSAQ